MAAGGRDQLGPIERLVRVLAVLDNAGERGAALGKLLEAGQYGAVDPEDQQRMLRRDITHLNNVGWDIQNAGDIGQESRFVLHTRDIRLRVELTSAQQAELARAARLGGVDEFADYVGVEPPEGATPGQSAKPDVNLVLCMEATAQRRAVQFIYKHRPRVVHPHLVQPGPSGWYLAGFEEASGTDKHFVVSRMTNLVLDKPGTVTASAEPRHRSFNPAMWDVDPPTDVQLETSPEFAEQVSLAMQPVLERREDGDRVLLTIRVTNRAAFRTRLYALGIRARVAGPDDVRAEIVAELSQAAT